MEASTQRARSGPDHSSAARPRPLARALPGDARPRLGQFPDPIGDAVLAEIAEVRPKRVGADAVHPGREVPVMHGPDDVGPGYVENLVAALVPVEVIEGHGTAL